MPKIVVSEFLTLDGVMQAPGNPDEDRSGGFEHGGWQLAYFDDIFGSTMMDAFAATGGLLLGRKPEPACERLQRHPLRKRADEHNEEDRIEDRRASRNSRRESERREHDRWRIAAGTAARQRGGVRHRASSPRCPPTGPSRSAGRP